jgi:hypothetical protein
MRDERIGWHIEHGDVDGAIALIDEIRRTPPEELRQMGQRAADIIKRRFDQNEMIDEFCKVVLRGLPPAATSNG